MCEINYETGIVPLNNLAEMVKELDALFNNDYERVESPSGDGSFYFIILDITEEELDAVIEIDDRLGFFNF